MLAPSLPRKSTERLARDVFDTFTFSVYIYDITDTDCWAHSGITHSRVFALFKRRVLNTQDEEQSENLLRVYMFLLQLFFGSVLL